MAGGKGMLPRPGQPPFLQRIRHGRPELPADWAGLTEDGLRERLKAMGCSDKMVESQISRYLAYKERVSSPRVPEKAEPEPEPGGDLLESIDRALRKGGS